MAETTKKKSLWVLIVIAIIFLGFYMFGFGKKINIEEIAIEVANGEAVLLDVRRQHELESEGYALASTHFDYELIEAGDLPKIDKEKTVYTYCEAGGRAGRAKKILEGGGFKKVVNIGGLDDWENAGGTVVRQ